MSMVKFRCQDLEVLEAPMEAFMASTSALLKLLDLRCVLGVSDGASGFLVGRVGNHFFPGQNLALESVWCSKVLEVTLARTLRTSDPDKSVIIDRDPELVGKPRSAKLVRIPLGAWNLAGLIDAAVDAIDGNDKDFTVLIIIYPNNLV
jgi:hypothetical protein